MTPIRKTVIAVSVAGVLAGAAVALPYLASADTVGPITFESPTYTIGNINGQNGWSALGSAGSGCAVYDEGVAASGGVSGFGSQSFRISNAVTSGCFGDQAFAPGVANAAGETGAQLGTFSGGTLQPHFESQFDLAVMSGSTGDNLSVSPDLGNGARMSYLRFENPGDGLVHVYFDDVTDPGHTTNGDVFNETQIATLNNTIPHTVKFSMDFYDGPDNDVVKIYIDGNLVHTGTSWEDYYRYDTESNPTSIANYTMAVRTMLFRAAGTAVPANSGKGYLIDNLSLSTGDIAAPAPACTTLHLVSGTDTQTAGFNNTANPSTFNVPSSMQAYSYGDTQGTWRDADATQTVIPPWVDPSTDSNFSGSGAVWVSTDPTWPGHAGNTEGSQHDDQWRLFGDSFVIPAGATITGASIAFTADNATDVYLNGNTTPIASTGDTYGPANVSNPPYYSNVYTTNFTPQTGYNRFDFVVRNWSDPVLSDNTNPTGLLYNATVTYCEPIPTGSLTVTKHVTNENTPHTFTFTGDGGIGTFTITASKNNDGTYTIPDLVPGTYTITETVPAGWVENTTSCNNVVVTAGQTASCTIKNTETQSTVIHVHNDNSATVISGTSASSNTGGNTAGGSAGGSGGSGGHAFNFGGGGNSATGGHGGNGSTGGAGGVVLTGDARASAGSLNVVNTNVVRGGHSH